MNEELKYLLYFLGALVTPVLAYGLWTLIKEKYTEHQAKLSYTSKLAHELQNEVSVLRGKLSRTESFVHKEIVEIKNVVSVYETRDVNSVYLSQIDRLKADLEVLRSTLHKAQAGLLKAEKSIERMDALILTLYKIILRLRFRLNRLQDMHSASQAPLPSPLPLPKDETDSSGIS